MTQQSYCGVIAAAAEVVVVVVLIVDVVIILGGIRTSLFSWKAMDVFLIGRRDGKGGGGGGGTVLCVYRTVSFQQSYRHADCL